MRTLIVKSLEAIAYVAIILVVLGLGAAGAATMGGFTGFIVGALAGAVLSVAIFGALFLLIDIADNTRRTARAMAAPAPADDLRAA